mmetsp:Transcript_10992/g.17402  ORF Transcript_10992/g.17402 Transcript_10992/m.17402 type:complete len:114 (+) Transcript_10992:427-768(+)
MGNAASLMNKLTSDRLVSAITDADGTDDDDAIVRGLLFTDTTENDSTTTTTPTALSLRGDSSGVNARNILRRDGIVLVLLLVWEGGMMVPVPAVMVSVRYDRIVTSLALEVSS